VIALAKAKLGALVVAQARDNGASGLVYIVAIGRTKVRVRKADAPDDTLHDVGVWPEELFHLDAVELRAGLNEIDLDRPRPPAAAPALAPVPSREPLVTISVPDPRRPAYAFPTREDPNPTTYFPEDSEVLNNAGVSRKVIRVPASLVPLVLMGVDGSHRAGELPNSVLVGEGEF
jgi:hypothetical protein